MLVVSCTALESGNRGVDVTSHVRQMERASQRVVHSLQFWVTCNRGRTFHVQKRTKKESLKRGRRYNLDRFADCDLPTMQSSLCDMELESSIADVE